VKKATICLVAMGIFGVGGRARHLRRRLGRRRSVERFAHDEGGVNFRRAGGSTSWIFMGRNCCRGRVAKLRWRARATALRSMRNSRGFEEATKCWTGIPDVRAMAVSPQGRAVNLGEVVLNHGTRARQGNQRYQTFGMIVTAEPYFAVQQPGKWWCWRT